MATDTVRHAVIDTDLCPLVLVADDAHLVGVRFERSMHPATTYGAIAEQLGNPRFAQRVGQVVGFGGGLDRKRRLLDLEEPPERRSERLF